MKLKKRLDTLYCRYNRREFVHPDPLEFLYDYPDPRDREIAGLVAACLAYGRVARILKSVSLVLEPMNPSPRAFLERASSRDIRSSLNGFVHRFSTGEHVSALLIEIKSVLNRFGSLEACFSNGFHRKDTSIQSALEQFVDCLISGAGVSPGHLLPMPSRGSACKRLHLYLRWMVRNDVVDPGGWKNLPASRLIIPLDTHMYRIGLGLGFTTRRQANGITALEVTRGFRQICPTDPVKYDFSLTRLGIRDDTDFDLELKYLTDSVV